MKNIIHPSIFPIPTPFPPNPTGYLIKKLLETIFGKNKKDKEDKEKDKTSLNDIFKN